MGNSTRHMTECLESLSSNKVLLHGTQFSERIHQLAVAFKRLLLRPLALGDFRMQLHIRIRKFDRALLYSSFKFIVRQFECYLCPLARNRILNRAKQQMIIHVAFH